ncbi:hypothetical protein SNE40_016557 [Patella caerulea]|uniref:Uncharacterized protein n=1 Tax=Patella caerulea TaxID=87958 RepID=A0AAN8J9G7_PATCE
MAQYRCVICVTIIVLVLYSCALTGHGMLFTLNAADARGNHSFSQRSNSTTGRVVKLGLGSSISFNICLRENTTIFVNKVRYSNDGIPDKCILYMDDIKVATFTTRNWTGWGEMWNVFEDFVIRTGFELPRGWHVVKLEIVSGDGVEIDGLVLDVSDKRLTEDMLNCKLLCQANGPVVVNKNSNQLPQYGLISQSSYPTKCAEEDNVKIPIVLHGIQEYSLTASLPTYTTFENRRGENTTGCSFLPHVYWTFTNITLPSKMKLYKAGSATLSIFRNSISYLLSKSTSITFKLFGRSKGHIDAEIGSIFKISIVPINRVVEVRLVLTGRSPRSIMLKSQYFLPGERVMRFDIPDFTWSEDKLNSVTVTFNSYAASSITIREMQLERRVMKPEITETIFESGELVIDAVYMDFWWRAPESMKINILPKAEIYPNVAYFRVSRPIPWTTDSYAQIFVLYQDGNARLLQLPPPGLDWIPFGSSVIIGSTDPKSHRPSAPISEVDIDPYSFKFNIRYVDGSSADFKLSSTIEETEIVVSNLKFAQDMSIHPFATLRSMYVEEGNSDCDSLMIDGEKSYHIMDDWHPKNGRSFMFYRRCESKHLTLSPDILLTVRRSQAGSVANWWQLYLAWRRSGEPSFANFKRYP